jgi:hypothetical protein
VLRDTTEACERNRSDFTARNRRRLSYDLPMIVGAIGFGIEYLRGVRRCADTHDHGGLTPFDRRRRQLVEAGFARLLVQALHKTMTTLQVLVETPVDSGVQHGDQDEGRARDAVAERLALTAMLLTGATLLHELAKSNTGTEPGPEVNDANQEVEAVGQKDDSVALTACEWVRRELVEAGVVQVTLRLLGLRRAPSVLKAGPKPSDATPGLQKKAGTPQAKPARFGGMATAMAVASQQHFAPRGCSVDLSDTDPFDRSATAGTRQTESRQLLKGTGGKDGIALGRGVTGRARSLHSHRTNTANAIVLSDPSGLQRTALRLEPTGTNSAVAVTDRSHEQISAGTQLRALVENNTTATVTANTWSAGNDEELEQSVRTRLDEEDDVDMMKYLSRKEMEAQLLVLCKAHPELHISRQLVHFVSLTDEEALAEWKRQMQKEAQGDEVDGDEVDRDEVDGDDRMKRLTPRGKEALQMGESESAEIIAASVLSSLRRSRQQHSTKHTIAQIKMLVEQLHHHCENDDQYRMLEEQYTTPGERSMAQSGMQQSVVAELAALQEEEEGEEWKDLMCDLRSSAIGTGRSVGEALFEERIGRAKARAAVVTGHTENGHIKKKNDNHRGDAAREAGAAAAEFVNSRMVISVGDKRRDFAEMDRRNNLRKGKKACHHTQSAVDMPSGEDAFSSYQRAIGQNLAAKRGGEEANLAQSDVNCIRVSSVTKAAAISAQIACAAASCFTNAPGNNWPLLVRGVGCSTAFHFVKDRGGSDEEARAAGVAADASAAIAYSGRSVELSLHSAQRMLALCKRIAAENVEVEQRAAVHAVNMEKGGEEEHGEGRGNFGKSLDDGMLMRPRLGYGLREERQGQSMEATARAAAAAAKRRARRRGKKPVVQTEEVSKSERAPLAPQLPTSAWETNEAISALGLYILATLSWDERTQQPVSGGLDAGGVIAGASPVWDECCRNGMSTSVGVVGVCPPRSSVKPSQAPFHRGVHLAGPLVAVSLLQLQLRLHRRLEVEEVLSRFSHWHARVVRDLRAALRVENRFEREQLVKAKDAARDLMREWRKRPVLSTLMGRDGEVVGGNSLHHGARGATAAFSHSTGGAGEKWLRQLVLTADVMMMVRCGGWSDAEKRRRSWQKSVEAHEQESSESRAQKNSQAHGRKRSQAHGQQSSQVHGRKSSVARDGHMVWGTGGMMEGADVFDSHDPNHNAFGNFEMGHEAQAEPLTNSGKTYKTCRDEVDASAALWAEGGEIEQAVKLARILHRIGEMWGGVLNEIDLVDEEQRQRADDAGPDQSLSALRKANQTFRANGAETSVDALRECVRKLEVWARDRRKPADAHGGGRGAYAGVTLPFSMRSHEGRELLQSALFSLALHDAGVSKDWIEAMRDVRATVEWQEWRARNAIAALSEGAAATIRYASLAAEAEAEDPIPIPQAKGKNLKTLRGVAMERLAPSPKHNTTRNDTSNADSIAYQRALLSRGVSSRYFPSYSSCTISNKEKKTSFNGESEEDPVQATAFELSADLLPDLFALVGRVMWRHRKESSVVLPGLLFIGHISSSRCYQHVMARGVRSDSDASASVDILPKGVGEMIPVQDNIELLTTLMWHHLPDPRAQRLGSRALQQLSQASVPHQQRMGECATVELLLRVLAYRHPKNKHIGAHVDNEGIVTALLPVLGNLAYNFEVYHASILSRLQRERRAARRQRRLVDLEWRQRREDEMAMLETNGNTNGNINSTLGASRVHIDDLNDTDIDDDNQEFAYQHQSEGSRSDGSTLSSVPTYNDKELQKSINARGERQHCRRDVLSQLEQRARISSDKIKTGLKRGAAVRAILRTMLVHKFSPKVNRVGLIALGNINHPTSDAVEMDAASAKTAIADDGLGAAEGLRSSGQQAALQDQLTLPTCALNAVLTRFLYNPSIAEWALWTGGKLAKVFAAEASSFKSGLGGVSRAEQFYLLLIASLHMNPSNARVVHLALWAAAELETSLQERVNSMKDTMGPVVSGPATGGGDSVTSPKSDDRYVEGGSTSAGARPVRQWDSSALEFGGASDPLRKMHKMLDLVDANVNMNHHVRGRAKAMPPSVVGLVHRLKMAKARGAQGAASASALYEGVSMHADDAWRMGIRDARNDRQAASLSSNSASAARFEEQIFGENESETSGGGGGGGETKSALSVPECLDWLKSIAATRDQQCERQQKKASGGSESSRRQLRHNRRLREWHDNQLDALREVVGGSEVVALKLALGSLQMQLQSQLEGKLKAEQAGAAVSGESGGAEQSHASNAATLRLEKRKKSKLTQQLKNGLKVGVQSLEALLLTHSGELWRIGKAQEAAGIGNTSLSETDGGGCANTPTPLTRRLMLACNANAALKAVLQGLTRYIHNCYAAGTDSVSTRAATAAAAKSDGGGTGGTAFIFVAHRPLLMQLVMQALFVHYYTDSSGLLVAAEEAIARSNDGTVSRVAKQRMSTRSSFFGGDGVRVTSNNESLLSVGADALRQSDLPGLLSRLLKLQNTVVSECMHVFDALALHASNHTVLMRYRAPQLVAEVCLVCWEAELVGGSEATATSQARPRNQWTMVGDGADSGWCGGSTRHLPRLRSRTWAHSDYARAADEFSGRQSNLENARVGVRLKAMGKTRSKFAHGEGSGLDGPVDDHVGLDEEEAEMVAGVWAEARAVREVDEAEAALSAFEPHTQSGGGANGGGSVVGTLLCALHRSEGADAIAKERAGFVAFRAHANLRELRSRGSDGISSAGSAGYTTGNSGNEGAVDAPLSSSSGSAALFSSADSATSFLGASAEAYHKRPGEAFGRATHQTKSKNRGSTGMDTGMSMSMNSTVDGIGEQDDFGRPSATGFGGNHGSMGYGAWGDTIDGFDADEKGEGSQYAPTSVVLSGMTLLARLALNQSLGWQLDDQGATLLGEIVLHQGKQGGRYAWRNEYRAVGANSTQGKGQTMSLSVDSSVDHSNGLGGVDAASTRSVMAMGAGAAITASARALNKQLRYQCLCLLRRLASVPSLKVYERLATVRTVLMLVGDLDAVLQTFSTGVVDSITRGIASYTVGLMWSLANDNTRVQQMVVQAGGRTSAMKLASAAKQMYSGEAGYQEMQRMCRGLLSVLPVEGADQSHLRTGPIGFGRRATQ